MSEMEDWEKQIWFSRCTVRYMQRLKVSWAVARMFSLENEPSYEWGPEESCDEDLNYWSS